MRGVIPTEEALRLAKETEMDLVEVSPNADPPVCKLLDYGKFRYQQQKRDHEAKRKHHGGDLKEVRFRLKTDTHDREIKVNRARRFLEEGHRVQITLMFRGREMQHMDTARAALAALVKELEDVAKMERSPSREGRRMSLTIMPKPGLKPRSGSGRQAAQSGRHEAASAPADTADAAGDAGAEPGAPPPG